MPTLQDEVSFLNGLNADGGIAAASFWDWNGTDPATYQYQTTHAPGKWGSAVAGTSGGMIHYYFDAASNWTASEQAAFVAGMALWSDLADITFSPAADAASAQLTFVRGSDGAAYESTTSINNNGGQSLSTYTSAYISIDTSNIGFGTLADGDFTDSNGYAFQTLIHEEGHALGLGHGGPYNGSVNAATQQYSAYDSRIWTLMSYVDPSFNTDARFAAGYPVNVNWVSSDYSAHYPLTPMALDILAVQALYGKPLTTALSGGQVFGFNCNVTGAAHEFFDFTVDKVPVITLWDLGTNNTLDLSGFASGSTVDLAPGSFSSCAGLTNNLCIAFDTLIDTAIGGSGNDRLTGNDDNNTLRGQGGNDWLDGRDGVNLLYGGAGNDTYVVNSTQDVISEETTPGTDDGGVDTIVTSMTWVLGTEFENLVLTGTAALDGYGNDARNSLTGNDGDNQLFGYGGSDILDGGAGNDTLTGGLGNDTYVVDNPGDVIFELAGEGTDTVKAAYSYVLGAVFENLTLTGSANIDATGNSINNTVTGNAGNNVIDGGAGINQLYGGGGDDTFMVWTTHDHVFENAGQGTDTVISAITYLLTANVENLTLTGTANLNGTGNTLGNVLVGNAGNNTLTGDAGNDRLDGGAGINQLYGGAGNDTYVVASTHDHVFENASEGTDTVLSAITYVLGDNVENLTLTGTGSINGTGNGLNNSLTGNAGNNSLTGGAGNDRLDGGAGINQLYGGAGNDTYVVASTHDHVFENASEGTDTVLSAITYVLGDNVENLTLTGTGSINGTGNALNNTIIGNAGDNLLNGGAGTNQLRGGAGDDTYVVASTHDTVVENAGEGFDEVQSAVTWVLGDNVEDLTLTGSGTISGTGNGLDNTIIGNSGSNTLKGMDGDDWLDGGGGANQLYGGVGDDVFIVASASDHVFENAAEGTDTVRSAITYALGDNVENLILTGSGVVNGTGNALDNIITGNAHDNILAGGDGNDVLRGGAGNDTMTGGAGSDTFVLGLAGSANGQDHLVDFEPGVDKLSFSGADYGLPPGFVLDSATLTFGTHAVGPYGQFVFNPTTHTLHIDWNGAAAGGSLTIAIFDNGVSITAADIVFT